jgi:hypothetical protein
MITIGCTRRIHMKFVDESIDINQFNVDKYSIDMKIDFDDIETMDNAHDVNHSFNGFCSFVFSSNSND